MKFQLLYIFESAGELSDVFFSDYQSYKASQIMCCVVPFILSATVFNSLVDFHLQAKT